MTNILRQSTQVVVRIGPFMDATDAVTPETGITLAAADQAEALKAAGAATVDISGDTWAAIANCGGWYDLTLTTTDTNTIGDLTIVIQDTSVCLPVFARFQVIEEAAYDTIYAASALPASTTNITAGVITTATNVTTVNGLAVNVITAASIATAAIDADAIAADAIAATKIASGAITNAKFAAGAIDAAAIAADAIGASEFAQGAADKVWATAARILTAGTNIVLPSNGLSAVTAWTVALTGNITGNLSGSVGSVTGAVGSVAGAVGSVTGNVVGSVGSLATQAKADVNAEVVDALNVDTYAEPGQANPPATASIQAKVSYNYKMMRNKKDQSATLFQLYDDAGVVVDQKSNVSDDGTTATRGELTSGP